jgi:hypothetical protein
MGVIRDEGARQMVGIVESAHAGSIRQTDAELSREIVARAPLRHNAVLFGGNVGPIIGYVISRTCVFADPMIRHLPFTLPFKQLFGEDEKPPADAK